MEMTYVFLEILGFNLINNWKLLGSTDIVHNLYNLCTCIIIILNIEISLTASKSMHITSKVMMMNLTLFVRIMFDLKFFLCGLQFVWVTTTVIQRMLSGWK